MGTAALAIACCVLFSCTLKGELHFPLAQYGDFALAPNNNTLNPSTANPKTQEFGTPHLAIVKTASNYSVVKLPQLGMQLNVPYGWGSKGGFETSERIDFFPAITLENLKQASVKPSPVNFGIKVLDSAGIGAKDYPGVLANVTKMMTGMGENVTTETDPQKHAFLVKIGTVVNKGLATLTTTYSLFLQSPLAGSRVWIDIDIRAPKTEFPKYLGLLGLIYKDIQIDWKGLEAYLNSKSG